MPLSRLAEQWPSARGHVKRLEKTRTVRITSRAAPERSFFRDESVRDAPPDLTEAQQAAVTAIETAGACPRAEDVHAPRRHRLPEEDRGLPARHLARA